MNDARPCIRLLSWPKLSSGFISVKDAQPRPRRPSSPQPADYHGCIQTSDALLGCLCDRISHTIILFGQNGRPLSPSSYQITYNLLSFSLNGQPLSAQWTWHSSCLSSSGEGTIPLATLLFGMGAIQQGPQRRVAPEHFASLRRTIAIRCLCRGRKTTAPCKPSTPSWLSTMIP